MLKQFYMIFKKLVIFSLFFRKQRFHFIFDFHFPAIFKLRNRVLCKQIKKSVPELHSFYGMESFINLRVVVPCVHRVLLALKSHVSRVLRALMPYVPRALRVTVLHMPIVFYVNIFKQRQQIGFHFFETLSISFKGTLMQI